MVYIMLCETLESRLGLAFIVFLESPTPEHF